MKTYSAIALLLAGGLAGTALTLSCSDDSPGDADASTCECAPAEPPLTGRIVRTRQEISIDPNAVGIAGPGCPAGATVLGGSCRLALPDPAVFLSEAGVEMQSYLCIWKSTSLQRATGVSEAICLLPAP